MALSASHNSSTSLWLPQHADFLLKTRSFDFRLCEDHPPIWSTDPGVARSVNHYVNANWEHGICTVLHRLPFLSSVHLDVINSRSLNDAHYYFPDVQHLSMRGFKNGQGVPADPAYLDYHPGEGVHNAAFPVGIFRKLQSLRLQRIEPSAPWGSASWIKSQLLGVEMPTVHLILDIRISKGLKWLQELPYLQHVTITLTEKETTTVQIAEILDALQDPRMSSRETLHTLNICGEGSSFVRKYDLSLRNNTGPMMLLGKLVKMSLPATERMMTFDTQVLCVNGSARPAWQFSLPQLTIIELVFGRYAPTTDLRSAFLRSQALIRKYQILPKLEVYRLKVDRKALLKLKREDEGSFAEVVETIRDLVGGLQKKLPSNAVVDQQPKIEYVELEQFLSERGMSKGDEPQELRSAEG